MKPTQVAATYARVSLDRQVDNFSLPSQRESMLKLAREKGYHVPHELEFVDEGLLGGEADRPGFVALREAVRGGLVKAVICHDLDRLVRGLALQMLMMDEAEKHDVALEFVTTPVEKSPEGRMLLQMKGVFAEYEKYKIRERTTRGRRQMAEMGYRPSARPPYGYIYRNEGRRGELVIHSERSLIVKRIFAEAEQGATCGAIARSLNEDGIHTAEGREWGREVIAQLLRCSTYAGKALYNRREQVEPVKRRKEPRPGRSKRTAQRLRPQAEWIEIPVPPIIGADQFARVREIMERTRALHVGRPSRSYLLRGLVKCAGCGRPLNVFPNHGRPRYRCSNYHRLTGEQYCQMACRTTAVRSLEEAVWRRVEELYSDPDTMAREIRQNLERRNAGRKDSAREQAALTKTIEKLRAREFQSVQMMLDSDMADYSAKIKADLHRTRQDRRAAEEKLKALTVAPAFEMPNLDRICRETHGRITAATTFEEKREILTEIVSRIDVDPLGESEVHLRPAGNAAPAADPVNGTNRKHCQHEAFNLLQLGLRVKVA